ncbi:MAG: SurA N-terminal domain-containing protein, partial [Parvibaculaceae bacterium]|nr:SurA N-terminal domain-containing protein [Parvibaculaceae bacterium]
MAQLDEAKSPATLSEKWVSAAAAAGLAFAIWSALGSPLPSFEEGEVAIAYVNDVPITQEEYARALEAIRADATHTLTQNDKQRALDVLVREELLVQRAEQMGIVKTDRTIRKAIVDAMMISIRTEER